MDKPNAFAFKAYIDEEYKVCICPRIDDSWSEKNIFYLSEPSKEFYDSLENELFHVVFLNYNETDEGGIWIDPGPNPFYAKHPEKKAKELYAENQFFQTIEHIYKEVYEKKPTEESTDTEVSKQTGGEGGQTETGE